MGVPAEAAPRQGVLPQVHQVDEQGEGSIQAGGLEGGVPVVGHAQEQARHELRDDGTGPEVLLSEGHFGQSRRPETRVSVRGSSQRHCGNRLYGRVNY